MAEENLPVKADLDKMAEQFALALPQHIGVDKFIRIVLTAVNSNPDLLAADRRTLLESAMKSAQDGLLPDGREAAFVVYNTNVAPQGQPKRFIKKVQYLPMVWGIVKKVRNSGELAGIAAHVVFENDEFSYALGDEESIHHKPLLAGDRGKPMAVYAIAKTKDGSIYREVLSRDDVDAVRNVSRAKESGPWAGPFALEMWRKTAIRRLAKRLPMSTDLESVIRRDDEMYDLQRHPVELPDPMPKRMSEAEPKPEEPKPPEAEAEVKTAAPAEKLL